MQLEKTTDYGLFIENSEQRQIDMKHAKRISAQMKSFGFLPSKPIQCYRKGKKLVVVDGHHRLEAAKMAEIPVFYVVEEKTAQDTMVFENMLVKRWMLSDYLRLFCARGVSDYVSVSKYVQQGIPAKSAVSLLVGEAASSGNQMKAFSEGRFKIKTTYFADSIVDLFNEFGKKSEAVKSLPFIQAISECLLCPDFSLDTFKTRMRKNPSIIVKTSSKNQMLELIEKTYNYGSKAPIPLAFKVRESSAVRQRSFGKSV